ncbi:MAG: DUF1385 domain-containing protein [Proteocatella sp.]|nr:DUF1385 domain-containing protein [Proteocatella sp.]
MYLKDKARIPAGGQALIEGVMMKCGSSKAIAVRKSDGTIEVKREKLSVPKDGSIKKLPFVRGMFMLVESMVEGGKDLTYSANLYAEGFDEEEESKFDRWLRKVFGDRLDDVINMVSIVLSVIIAVGLFIVLPTVIGKGAAADRTFTVALREGALKLSIFVGYLLLMSQVKDIKRVFQYHGAEHKSIFAYEQGIELNVENVKKMGRLHPRCGTNFMFVVIAISIAIFSFVGIRNVWLRSLVKIAVFPLMAGISYEIIRFAGKHQNGFTRAMVWPGLMMQKITTKEPDDSQIEVAIASLKAVLEDEGIIKREFATTAEVVDPETLI